METRRTEILRIEGLSKNFGKLTVLKDVSFSIAEGELIAVLGPSGCGKTTLLRAVAGLVPFDGGRVLVRGKDVAGHQSGDIGMVFQEPRLLPWRTTRGNVRLPFELAGQTSGVDEAVTSALELVGLTEFADAYPHQLSGGMKSRVSLARALATEPGILLMDEPLTGLTCAPKKSFRTRLPASGERKASAWCGSPMPPKRRCTWLTASSCCPAAPPASGRY